MYLRILQYTMINQQKKAINRIKAVLAKKQLSGKWLANEIGRTENAVIKEIKELEAKRTDLDKEIEGYLKELGIM